MSPFDQARETLRNGHTFGIWSLIVTLFGDMAQEPDKKISGASLTAICEKLGIKSQAMRVALHRLRKDGWIDGEKTGRRSTYFLTDASRAESVKASAQIYATSAPSFDGYVLCVAPKNILNTLAISPSIPINPEIEISFQKPSETSKDVVLSHHNGPVPEWIAERIVTSDTVAAYQALEQRLVPMDPSTWNDFSTTEIVAMRVLLVHEWRRLVLRHPVLPDEAFPSQCPRSKCRDRVFDLLSNLPRPPLSELGA